MEINHPIMYNNNTFLTKPSFMQECNEHAMNALSSPSLQLPVMQSSTSIDVYSSLCPQAQGPQAHTP